MIESFTSQVLVNNRQEFWPLGDGILTSGATYIPTLDLQFAGATSLDSRITFTRASTATYFNSAGVLSTAAINTARLDYNPSTLAPLGLLREEQRTNSLLQSENFATTWTATNVTVTANTATAPDGATTADTFSDGVANAVHDVSQTVVTTAATTYTLSAFLKNVDRQYAILACSGSTTSYASAKFDLSAGTLGSTAASGAGWSVTSSSISAIGNGWYRCTITFVVGTTTGTAARVGMASDGTTFTASQRGLEVYTGSNKTFYAWGAQLEAGAFATSYIPTTTTALTRNADVASMTGTNFSSWYNASEGTFISVHEAPQTFTSYPTAFSAWDGASSEYMLGNFNTTGAPRFERKTGGVAAGSLNASVVTAGSLVKQGIAYKANDFALVANGGSAVTSSSGNVPSNNQLSIGGYLGGTGSALNSYIQRITYYPTRLANSTLQALTA